MFHCNDLSRSLYLAFNPLSNRSLPNKNLCPSNFSPNVSIRDAYLLQKERKKRERKGNIFNEFQTNGSILFQRFVKKKKKKNLSREITPGFPFSGGVIFHINSRGRVNPIERRAGDTEGSFKILLLPGGIPDKSSR